MRTLAVSLAVAVTLLALATAAGALTVKPIQPPLPESSVEATLTYLGGAPGNQMYRYDFKVTNISVLPAIQTVLIFFDSDPFSGEFTGDKADFVELTTPLNWEGTAWVDPDPSPWYVEFATFSGPARIFPGSSKTGFSVTAVWKDPLTVPGQRFFEAMNGVVYEGQVVIGVQIDVSGSICGDIIDECAGASHPPVTVDLFDANGVLVAATTTDEDGHYCFHELLLGSYTVSVVTPLGFVFDQESKQAIVYVGQTSDVDFYLSCLDIQPSQRTIGYWKHQVNALLMGKGKPQETLAAMIEYVHAIRVHFNENVYNPVLVYQVPDLPDGATAADSLMSLGQLLTVNKEGTMLDRAKQQMMALLLNVASLKISQAHVISADGANVSQAITYCNDVLTDQVPGVSYEVAKDIADVINNGGVVPAGVIPLDTRMIWYNIPGISLVDLNPNPFDSFVAVRYSVPRGSAHTASARLDVYDISGRLVYSFGRLDLAPGEHEVVWEGVDNSGNRVASGVYFISATSGSASSCQKVTLIRSR